MPTNQVVEYYPSKQQEDWADMEGEPSMIYHVSMPDKPCSAKVEQHITHCTVRLLDVGGEQMFALRLPVGMVSDALTIARLYVGVC